MNWYSFSWSRIIATKKKKKKKIKTTKNPQKIKLVKMVKYIPILLQLSKFYIGFTFNSVKNENLIWMFTDGQPETNQWCMSSCCLWWFSIIIDILNFKVNCYLMYTRQSRSSMLMLLTFLCFNFVILRLFSSAHFTLNFRKRFTILITSKADGTKMLNNHM